MFEITVVGGLVQRITFRAEPEALAQLLRRQGNGGGRALTPPLSHLLGADRQACEPRPPNPEEQAGDATHQEARDAMKGRWRRPRKSLDWYRDAKKTFAGLPEE